MNMTKPILTPARERKLVYDRERARAVRAGTWDTSARAAAAEKAATAQAKLVERRARDKAYRKAVRAAEKIGAPKAVALEQGRKARAELVTIWEPWRVKDAQVCQFFKLTRKSLRSANYDRVRATPPPLVAVIAPKAGAPFWGRYSVATEAQATHWCTWLVGPRGNIKDVTIRLLTYTDAINNAHERAEMPTNSAVDRLRGARTLWLIVIPLKYAK